MLAEFKDPPTENDIKLRLLDQCIQLNKKVSALESWNASSLFNCAQAMNSLVALLMSRQDAVTISLPRMLTEALQILDECQKQSEQARLIERDESDSNMDDRELSMVDDWEIASLKIDVWINLMDFTTDPGALEGLFNQCISALGQISDNKQSQKVDKIDIALRYAHVYSSFAHRSVHVFSNVTVACTLYEQALDSLDSGILCHDRRHIEALCDKGDILTEMAEIKRKLKPDDVDSSKKLYTLANDCYSQALQLEPKNISIITKLGDTNLSRVKLYAAECDLKTRQVLAQNARVFYQRSFPLSKDKEDKKWILYHWYKADTFLSDQTIESQRIWDALMKEFGNVYIPEWERDDDLVDVPFGPYQSISS